LRPLLAESTSVSRHGLASAERRTIEHLAELVKVKPL
jgi:hypothetical protein